MTLKPEDFGEPDIGLKIEALVFQAESITDAAINFIELSVSLGRTPQEAIAKCRELLRKSREAKILHKL